MVSIHSLGKRGDGGASGDEGRRGLGREMNKKMNGRRGGEASECGGGEKCGGAGRGGEEVLNENVFRGVALGLRADDAQRR